jgi:hypothetical protein
MTGVVALVVALAAPAAKADIQFTDAPGNLCQLTGLGGGCETNILFQAPNIGNPIVGQVGHSGVNVTFSSTTGQNLDQKAEGQADIFCTTGGTPCPSEAGGLTNLLTSMTMTAQTGTGWGDVDLNMQSGTGTALVTAFDNFGHSFQDPLSKGQNFLGIYAVPGSGEVITSVVITEFAPDDNGFFGFEEFKQPRVSGLCTITGPGTCTPINTPEPASLGLLGTGLLGLGLLARRRRR